MEEGEINALKNQIVKLHYALDMERQRCFQLEQQLHKQNSQESTLASMQARLIYVRYKRALSASTRVPDSLKSKLQSGRQSTMTWRVTLGVSSLS